MASLLCALSPSIKQDAVASTVRQVTCPALSTSNVSEDVTVASSRSGELDLDSVCIERDRDPFARRLREAAAWDKEVWDDYDARRKKLEKEGRILGKSGVRQQSFQAMEWHGQKPILSEDIPSSLTTAETVVRKERLVERPFLVGPRDAFSLSETRRDQAHPSAWQPENEGSAPHTTMSPVRAMTVGESPVQPRSSAATFASLNVQKSQRIREAKARAHSFQSDRDRRCSSSDVRGLESVTEKDEWINGRVTRLTQRAFEKRHSKTKPKRCMHRANASESEICRPTSKDSFLSYRSDLVDKDNGNTDIEASGDPSSIARPEGSFDEGTTELVSKFRERLDGHRKVVATFQRMRLEAERRRTDRLRKEILIPFDGVGLPNGVGKTGRPKPVERATSDDESFVREVDLVKEFLRRRQDKLTEAF